MFWRLSQTLPNFPKPVAQWSKCLLLAFRSKGHRFESPPGHEPPTVSECQSVSGTSLTLVSSAAVRPCQQCQEGYIAMVLCHTLSYSLWLIYQSEMSGFDISILSLALTMKASGKLGYQVSSSAEILSQTSSSVVKMLGACCQIQGS